MGNNYGKSFMAKIFLVVEPICLRKWVLKPKCAVTNVDWNNLTFEFLAKVKQSLLGTQFQNISRPEKHPSRRSI